MNKKLILGAAIIALLSGSGGVYAGTLIKQGKTPRENQYSVEKENIEKNKYQISVNGQVIPGTIISTGNTVYVPLKNLPKSKFAIKYNKSKWSYDLKTIEQFELSRDEMNFNKNHAIIMANYKEVYQTFVKLQTELTNKNEEFNINEAYVANDKVQKSISKLSEQKNELDIIYSRINHNKLEYSLFEKQTKRYLTLYKYTNASITEIIRYMQDVHSKFLEVGFIPNEELERLNSKVNAFKSFYESIPRKVRPE